MELITNLNRLAALAFALTAPSIASATTVLSPALPAANTTVAVGFYTTCSQPELLMLAFRNNTGQKLEVPEGHLPWNNRYALKTDALLVKDGKTTRVATHAPIADHMRRIPIEPGQVVTEGIDFGDIIRDFEKLNREGDIVLHYSIESGSPAPPRFISRPGTVLIPKKGMASASCPAIVTRPTESRPQ